MSLMRCSLPDGIPLLWRILVVAAVAVLVVCPGQVLAAGRLLEFLPKAQPSEVFPGADRFGTPQGEPPLAGAYAGDRLLGQVYLNSDFANAVGYSGKPIQMLVGIDPQGVIRGIKLVDHKEPIVLVGIPEKRVTASMNALIGKAMTSVASGAEGPPGGEHQRPRRARSGVWTSTNSRSATGSRSSGTARCADCTSPSAR